MQALKVARIKRDAQTKKAGIGKQQMDTHNPQSSESLEMLDDAEEEEIRSEEEGPDEVSPCSSPRQKTG